MQCINVLILKIVLVVLFIKLFLFYLDFIDIRNQYCNQFAGRRGKEWFSATLGWDPFAAINVSRPEVGSNFGHFRVTVHMCIESMTVRLNTTTYMSNFIYFRLLMLKYKRLKANLLKAKDVRKIIFWHSQGILPEICQIWE